MTEEEIRKIVRDKCKQIMTDAGLTDKDVIIKKDQPLSEKEVSQNGFTHMEFFKKVGEIVIMIGKRGYVIISIVAILWRFTQFGSMFLFEKELPDAVDLAKRAREGVIEYIADDRDRGTDSLEKWVVTSPSWESYDNTQYRRTVHDYTSGIRAPEELYTNDTIFIATTSMSIKSLKSTSGSPEDFKV